MTTALADPPTVYRCRDEYCEHIWSEDVAHFCPRCGSRAITVSPRRVVHTRSQRAERSCIVCGMVAANRRLFKRSERGYVCVDEQRCANRQELNAG